MTRNEEYNRLLAELDNTPPALEYTVTRAKARVKKAGRIHRFITLPAGSIALFFVAFVITVNASTTFAMACGKIPLIRELAAAVAFSPSLSATVLNDYVQPIELEQTENGITMRVEYAIVDQKQLNIFYSLQSKTYSNMDATPYISSPDGTPMEGYSIASHDLDAANDELRQFSLDFINGDVPSEIELTCKVHDNGRFIEDGPAPIATDKIEESKEPDFISTFTFLIKTDPYYTSHGDVILLNQSFVIDGQQLSATSVEIYPTHIRLNLLDDENNTAWLQSLSFYLVNENGKKFESINNGITATGSIDSPFMASHRLESSFFSESQSLSLYITDAVWLDKNMERIKINLESGTADKLPEGVNLEQIVRSGNDWQLTFSGTERQENSQYQLFGTKYFDETGNEYDYNSWSSTALERFDEGKNEHVEVAGVFKVQFSLENYPFETVYLSPSFSRTVHLATPIEISVK